MDEGMMSWYLGKISPTSGGVFYPPWIGLGFIPPQSHPNALATQSEKVYDGREFPWDSGPPKQCLRNSDSISSQKNKQLFVQKYFPCTTIRNGKRTILGMCMQFFCNVNASAHTSPSNIKKGIIDRP